MNDIERLMAGQCCHGRENFKDCLSCVIARYQVVMMRRMLANLFPGGK